MDIKKIHNNLNFRDCKKFYFNIIHCKILFFLTNLIWILKNISYNCIYLIIHIWNISEKWNQKKVKFKLINKIFLKFRIFFSPRHLKFFDSKNQKKKIFFLFLIHFTISIFTGFTNNSRDSLLSIHVQTGYIQTWWEMNKGELEDHEHVQPIFIFP